MPKVKVYKTYEVTPDGMYCGNCNHWLITYCCEVFDVTLTTDSQKNLLRCRKCLKKLPVEKANKYVSNTIRNKNKM
jgi:hypothetical protein